MNEVPNRANSPQRSGLFSNMDSLVKDLKGLSAYKATPAPRSATEAMKIVGEGNMGANVPNTPRGRRGMPTKMRKGRAK
jgi:hypothetical protein